jgi:signal peptidase II
MPLSVRYNQGNLNGWSNRLKKYLQSYGFLLSIAGLIIVFDQWTKYLVRTNLDFTESWAPWEWLAPFARIVHWKNTGAAFGMLQNFNVIFAALAVVISLAIIYYYPRVEKSDWPLRVALAMQMGGALGNLIDRLTQGYVTDFISVGRFAVFNIADASISVGVAVLVVGVWLKDRQETKKARAATESTEAEPEPEEKPQVEQQTPLE